MSSRPTNLCALLAQREMHMRQLRDHRTFEANLFRRRLRLAKNLYNTYLLAHYGCVNAIEFSNGGKYLASGGDDKRVLIWDIETAIAGCQQPRILNTEHTSNIFCLGFDSQNGKILSGGNDDLVIVHDFETGKLCNVFKHDHPVYGLSIDPHCDNIFATACEDGQVLVFDQRMDTADPLVVTKVRGSFHAVEFHPSGGNFLVTANSKRGAAFWDIRKPNTPVIQYGCPQGPPSCMSVRFNRAGNLILALRRRLPPILYNTQSPEPVCTFYHGNYYNSCTMKSATFAGEDDEFVLSGSDDFNLYVWRVTDVDLDRKDQWIEKTQMVLYGHRSIVNQVRYNRQKCLLASSGVEKIIKLWSPFAQKNWKGSLLRAGYRADCPRQLYSPYTFAAMSTTPNNWTHMSHDYSSRNTDEDPRMMAFFDSLIQQEIEDWENTSTESPIESECSAHSSNSSNDSSESSSDDNDDDDDDARGDGTAARSERRPKRNVVRRKDYKRRSSILRKIKPQRNKYANRIAYLIATKRNTLRRLAIKGATSCRRRHTVVKVGRSAKENFTCSSSTSKVKVCLRGCKRSGQRLNSTSTTTNNVPNNPVNASTSAASTSSSTCFRSQRKKLKKNRVYDTSDDDTESGDPAASSSSQYSGIPLANHAPIPSTSTGITSSLKENIIRLRRQQQHIIDSDEDDDEEPAVVVGIPRAINEPLVDATVQATKRVNGIRAQTNDADVLEPNDSHTILLPTDVPETDDTHIVQQSVAFERHIPNSLPFPSTSTSTSTEATMLPQSSTSHADHIVNNHYNRRRRPETELADNYSSHSNSRLSNSSYPDDMPGSSASLSRTEQPTRHNHNHMTPVKRRKLSIVDYINVRSMLSDEASDEANNNEQNNNNIFSSSYQRSESTFPMPQDTNDNNVEVVTHQNGTATASNSIECGDVLLEQTDQQPFDDSLASTSSQHTSLLRTPDSGISITTITPSVSFTSTQSSMSNISGHMLSPCIENAEMQDDSVPLHLQIYQQKLGRVRRNYRKKFADESDSD